MTLLSTAVHTTAITAIIVRIELGRTGKISSQQNSRRTNAFVVSAIPFALNLYSVTISDRVLARSLV